ncbi:hypothetical protein RQP53_23330 [Paucibacter sp. APW11]|uniref:Uncharacterized protein n=1 Tax=Roseateles aquae TaxID=3077235 RepID=A0ABU3PIP3_9BURK|nr:hypothetical protein [Paucibacter sp. APW11]MDT9002232.1 hypothetical protein [Paucibacter sp. APW11]
MSDLTLALECDSDASSSLSAALAEATHANVIEAEKNSLDGSLPTILQIVQVASSIAAIVTPIVTSYIASKKVKKIKFGDIEIENPTQEQWERLWSDYQARGVEPDNRG